MSHKKMTSFIYLMGTENGDFKIGQTSNRKRRLSAIQNGNPNKVKLITSRETESPNHDEKFLHKKFDKYRIPRTEWFKLPQEYIEDLSWFQDIPKANPENLNRQKKRNRKSEVFFKKIKLVADEICLQGEKVTQAAIAKKLGCAPIRISLFFRDNGYDWISFRDSCYSINSKLSIDIIHHAADAICKQGGQVNRASIVAHLGCSSKKFLDFCRNSNFDWVSFKSKYRRVSTSKVDVLLEEIKQAANDICARGDKLTQSTIADELMLRKNDISRFFSTFHSSWHDFRDSYKKQWPDSLSFRNPNISSQNISKEEIINASNKILELNEALTVENIAKRCNVAPFIVRNVFKKENKSWLQYKHECMTQDHILDEERIYYGLKVVLESNEKLTHAAIGKVINAKREAVQKYFSQNGVDWKYFRDEVQPDWYLR